jgi:hypothetical protein
MDQIEVGKLAAAHLQEIAFGIFMLMSGIGAMAYRSLTNCLKRCDASRWEALGRPRFFSKKLMKDELTFVWYILTRKYRQSEIREMRIFGDLNFVCALH